VITSDTLDLAAEVVAAFVANNSVPTGELPGLFEIVHTVLARLKDGVETPAPVAPTREPAVSIRASIRPDYLICLEDGKHFKALKRHVSGHGLTPDQYRAKWKLPSDYPMVAPNYAAARSALAKAMGLGQKPLKAGTPRRGRPSKPLG
jgi:predicted transcriptional regulator